MQMTQHATPETGRHGSYDDDGHVDDDDDVIIIQLIYRTLELAEATAADGLLNTCKHAHKTGLQLYDSRAHMF